MKDNKGTLRNIRVLKKNMIFLQSYDQHIPTSTLKQTSTFTPCGGVQSVKAKQNYKNSTTYVTYSNERSAAMALIAFSHLSSRLRVLFGTVQYCKYFMRKAECRNQDCVFLHLRDKKNQIIVNDQIEESVYDDHYDMALDILQQDDYKQVKILINDDSIDQNAPIKKGLRRAVEALNIDLSLTSESLLGMAKESQLSTEESDVGRDQTFEKSYGLQQSKNEQNTVNREYACQDILTIRIIKQLIRQNNSRFNFAQKDNQEQCNHRGKMMLYQMVKY